jgi:hypothetical protein
LQKYAAKGMVVEWKMGIDALGINLGVRIKTSLYVQPFNTFNYFAKAIEIVLKKKENHRWILKIKHV